MNDKFVIIFDLDGNLVDVEDIAAEVYACQTLIFLGISLIDMPLI